MSQHRTSAGPVQHHAAHDADELATLFDMLNITRVGGTNHHIQALMVLMTCVVMNAPADARLKNAKKFRPAPNVSAVQKLRSEQAAKAAQERRRHNTLKP